MEKGEKGVVDEEVAVILAGLVPNHQTPIIIQESSSSIISIIIEITVAPGHTPIQPTTIITTTIIEKEE